MMCNGFKLRDGRFTRGIGKKIFAVKVVKHWNGCRCHVPGIFQDQAGWASEKSALQEGVPVHSGGLGQDDL